MELHTIGIDLGKTVFHLVGVNVRGEVVLCKKFSRKQLLHFTANLQVKLIGMEACGGAHFLGRALRSRGMRYGWCRRSSQAVRKDEQERLH
jgi:transposase